MISTNPKEVIEYIHSYNFDSSSPILSSALAYHYLYLKHFNKPKTIKEILEENDYDIGLIGPGHMWPGSALSKLTYENETKNKTQFPKYALLFKNKIFRDNHENQQSLPFCSLLVPFSSKTRGPSQCPHTY